MTTISPARFGNTVAGQNLLWDSAAFPATASLSKEYARKKDCYFREVAGGRDSPGHGESSGGAAKGLETIEKHKSLFCLTVEETVGQQAAAEEETIVQVYRCRTRALKATLAWPMRACSYPTSRQRDWRGKQGRGEVPIAE